MTANLDYCHFVRAVCRWAVKTRRLRFQEYNALMRDLIALEHKVLGCNGKQGFLTYTAADEVARKMMRREPNVLVKPYACCVCGKFHVGHRSTKTLRARKHLRQGKKEVYA
jgi:hypothetical protein